MWVSNLPPTWSWRGVNMKWLDKHLPKWFCFLNFPTGTRIGQASECFVYWKDPMTNDTWGLNFTSPIDAKQFRECCVSCIIIIKLYFYRVSYPRDRSGGSFNLWLLHFIYQIIQNFPPKTSSSFSSFVELSFEKHLLVRVRNPRFENGFSTYFQLY